MNTATTHSGGLIMRVVYGENAGCLKALLAGGADVNRSDKYGISALGVATQIVNQNAQLLYDRLGPPRTTKQEIKLWGKSEMCKSAY